MITTYDDLQCFKPRCAAKVEPFMVKVSASNGQEAVRLGWGYTRSWLELRIKKFGAKKYQNAYLQLAFTDSNATNIRKEAMFEYIKELDPSWLYCPNHRALERLTQ